jgi:Tol biopolymer transport system component
MGGPAQEFAGEWSPDGKQLVIPSSRTGRFELYLVPVVGGQPRQITTSGSGTLETWSPDGKWIADPTPRAIVLISPVTAAAKTIAPKPLLDSAVFAGGVGWSADSQEIYFLIQDARGNEDIGVMSVDGSNPRLLVRFDRPDMPMYRANFSTDGRSFYFPIGRQEADIWVMDLVRR